MIVPIISCCDVTRKSWNFEKGRVSIDNFAANLTAEILILISNCSFLREHSRESRIVNTKLELVKSTRTRLFTFWKLNFFVYSFLDSTKAISWSVILKLYEFTTRALGPFPRDIRSFCTCHVMSLLWTGNSVSTGYNFSPN